MPEVRDSWSTQQLAEFLTVVSSFTDEDAARRGAVERAAEALEAEIAAVVEIGAPVISVGFARGDAPTDVLIDVARSGQRSIDIPGVGECRVLTAALDDDKPGWLLVGRAGDEDFSAQEASLLNGMARVLTLALRAVGMLANERALRERSESQARENVSLLLELQERQVLLERLTKIQRSIVRRTVLRDVLDAIVDGAKELIRDEIVLLRLLDPEAPGWLVIAASRGMKTGFVEATQRSRVGVGASGQAVANGRLVAIENYVGDASVSPAVVAERVEAAMAAPVHENGRVIGSLTVASLVPGRSYGSTEREVLLAFAEHASLALTDARNFDNAVHQAFHDPLTGLPNRALFLDRLEQARSRVERTGAPLAVLFIDLDSFKRVNDSLGHAPGDELLIETAHRLGQCIRPGDTAARFGGDEFAVLLEDTTRTDDAVHVAQRIMRSLQSPFALSGKEVSITISIGIATQREHSDDLLRNADLALYRAKSEGKSRYESFEPAMHAAMIERMELELDLQFAVTHEQFELHYQPIVSLEGQHVVAVEALVRWAHPRRGLLAPDEFIGAAEETRTILPIGRWVLRQACRQAAEWNETLTLERPLAVGVNLSMVQLQEPGLVDEVAAALQAARLHPGNLILEITETLLMHDVELVSDTLGRLKALGVQLAVDDFGTGYSSLQYLRRFPIDILKIAKSFIEGIGGGADDATLARAIIDLGESFQLRVVAEGIEEPAQVKRLLELGCEFGQGFHFARPMPAEQFTRELARETTQGDPSVRA
jgi:diguanylate cyclase (GGDEF)-like protein